MRAGPAASEWAHSGWETKSSLNVINLIQIFSDIGSQCVSLHWGVAGLEPPFALHENLSRHEVVKRPSERRFGFTLAVALFLLTAVGALRGDTLWPVTLTLALAFVGFVVFAPDSLKPLNRLWLQIGLALHTIVSPVVLIVLFFVVVTPVGLIARFAGKDFLRLRFDQEATTYWIDRRPPGPSPESMRNQF